MPVEMPDDFREVLFAEHGSDAILLLLEMNHESWSEPIYFVNNTVSIHRNGVTYVAAPFGAVMPSQREGGPGAATLKIENTTRAVLAKLRSISTPISLKFEQVLGANPETIGKTYTGLKLTKATWDSGFITGTLTGHRYQGVAYPYKRMDPKRAPGLFV